MTRDEVKTAIAECTEKLGHVPSRNELRKHGHISREHLRRHFGTYTRALEECNLKRRAVGGKLEMEALFLDWAGVVRSLRKLPTVHEYEDGGKYSQRPLLSRFGTWAQAPAGLKQYAEDHNLADQWKDVLGLVEEKDRKDKEREGAFGLDRLGLIKEANDFDPASPMCWSIDAAVPVAL